MSRANLRRFIRYEINLIATIVINDTNFIQCTIRNFCSAGLFLELQPNALHNANLTPQQKIKILFSTGTGIDAETIITDAKIIHIKSNGVGIIFESHSEAAYISLQKESKNSFCEAPESSHEDVPATNLRNAEDISKQENLSDELQSLLREALPQIIQSFIHRTEEKLAEDVEDVKNIELSSALQDAAYSLKINKDAISENFSTVTDDNSALVLPTLEQDEEDDTESSLSLIEKPDFEDWLDLSSIISNLESLYGKQLNQLQNKIAFILGITKNTAVNPASPAELCNKLHDSISTLTENAPLKSILYTLFEATLIELLPDLYEKLDNILVEYGAPKKPEKTTSPWLKIKPGTGQIKDDYQLPKLNSDLSLPDPETAIPEAPAPATPIIETAVPDFSSYTSKTDQPVATNHTANTGQPAATNYTTNADQPVVANQNIKPVINVARNLLNLAKGQNTPHQQTPATENIAEVYSTDEIIQGLTHLQQNAPANSTQHNTLHALEYELSHGLKNFSGSKKTLSNTDQNNIEVYESLFEILFKDMLLTQDTQSYLQRVQLPIMAQAIPDPAFLESNDHPARNIVNHLYWLGSAVVDNKTKKNTQIRQLINQQINQIINESADNPDVFITAEEQLNKITQSVHKSIDYNTKRVTGIFKAKQKRENAQSFVEEELQHRFGNKEIPKVIVTLLEAGWQQLLVIAKLQEDNNAFQSYLRIIINLISWLPGPITASKEQAETTLKFINTHLRSVCTNTLLHNNILRELNILLPENATQSNLDALQMVKPESKKKVQKTEQLIRHCDEVNRLEIGEWLAVLLDHEIEPLKLIWIAENSNLFVFADRNGLKKLELEYEDLANLFNSGAANKVENLDSPVMDRAINLMLQKMHKNLLNKATHDPVTHLLNRKELIKQLKHEIPRLDDSQHFICNIEVQDFRIITNACGHSGGEALLKKLADLLKSDLKKTDIVARLDDKTFTILLNGYSDEADNAANNIAKKLQSNLVSNAFTWKDKSYAIAVGIGIMPLYPAHARDLNSLLQNVDSATLSAINAGRNCIQVFDEDDESLKSQFNEYEWAGRINQVFSDNRLFLRCQKIAAIDPETESHTHYEILLGIKDENDKIIPPDDFIPSVERCQRMSEVDRWVVLNVFSWIEEHQFEFEMLDGFSINLSGESMNSEDFLIFLKNTLATCDVPLEKITFEITETVAASSFQFIQSFIKQIKEFNCKFSLDDFGTGYSSYAYLKSLNVDYLKIDGAFVKDILNNDSDVAIVKSMNEIAHSLGLKTIAEYVENDEIITRLKEIGVDYVQGWGVHKPMPLLELS